MKLKSPLIPILLVLAFAAPAWALPRVALYQGDGAWEQGLEHLQAFLNQAQIETHLVLPNDIQSGRLQNFDVLIMPGGASWKYLASLGPAGAKQILEFVNTGGGYLGICAGAFYATSGREGGHATGPYGIGLLDGVAYDGTALHTPPFHDGMLDFDLFIPGLLSRYRALLLGGPAFHYSADEANKKQIQVLAQFSGTNEPAVISLRYGQGKAALVAPHFEIEENQLDWNDTYQDPESDWPILNYLLDLIEPKPLS